MLNEYHKVRGGDYDKRSYNLRFLKRYNELFLTGFYGRRLLDVGAGNGGFVAVCRENGMAAYGVDREVDFEKDSLPAKDGTFGIVHLNAVIEHLENPENIMKEIHRVLVSPGYVVINTPNWALDYKNFYNDPTHKRPYTPEGLKFLVKMFGFEVVLCEPALIVPSIRWWKVPFKWRICSWIPKGSKSILLIGKK